METSPRPRLRDQLRWFAVAAVGIAVLGLAAGWLFAKGQPSSAAGALVADFVVTEPVASFSADQPADQTAVAPSSGPHADGVVRCGLVDDLSNADHLASLAAGVVVVRHRPAVGEDDLRVLRELVGRRGVLVAPEPDLDVEVAALSWGRRMPLDAVNRELLVAFHTAHVDALVPDRDVDLPTTCNGA